MHMRNWDAGWHTLCDLYSMTIFDSRIQAPNFGYQMLPQYSSQVQLSYFANPLDLE